MQIVSNLQQYNNSIDYIMFIIIFAIILNRNDFKIEQIDMFFIVINRTNKYH